MSEPNSIIFLLGILINCIFFGAAATYLSHLKGLSQNWGMALGTIFGVIGLLIRFFQTSKTDFKVTNVSKTEGFVRVLLLIVTVLGFGVFSEIYSFEYLSVVRNLLTAPLFILAIMGKNSFKYMIR